jgi:hypothetical protein
MGLRLVNGLEFEFPLSAANVVTSDRVETRTRRI